MTETCAEEANLPQSSRVDASTSSFVPATPPTPSSPPLRPNRSALRPATRSFASASDLSETATLVDNHMATSVLHRPSFASLSGLLDSMHAELEPFPPSPPLDTPRALPPMPESPFTLDSDTSSTSSHPIPAKPKLSRREHALMELLSSERSYASDLALTRDIHIPLALGHTSPFPTTPPSSGSSSRTLSTASGSSTASDPGPAMTREDARIIFGNIAELAVFADAFSERLEEALGGVIEGGQGDDRIGTLFLEIIPQMEPLYKTYITKHPTALGHLNSLPPTPALQAYLTYTQTVAASLSHAWDLPSLLIKPVQRLLKYPLLLGTIIEETPDAHPDKANLRAAKELMEAVAREVNEGRRRYEVVKEVLTGKPPAPADVAKAKEKGKKAKGTKPGVYVPVGLAAAVAIGKMKNLNLKSQRPQEGNEEAEVCERQEAEMKATVGFMKEFAKDALEWAGGVRETMRGLHGWAVGFARVIGLQDDQESEAFDAFLEVVNKQLLPLGEELEGAVEERVLIQLAKLVKATE